MFFAVFALRCEDGEATLSVQNVKGLTTQFSWYKNWQKEVVSLVGPEKGNNIISRAPYIFSTGTNDWINSYYTNPVVMAKYTREAYTVYIPSGHCPILHPVLGLPPFGCLPAEITLYGNGNPGCVEDFNNVAVHFNQQMQTMFNDLKPTLHGSRLIYLDTYNLLYKFVQNPQEYGTHSLSA